jgi:glycosyltransferase involved in cell wall biosynthesis
VAQDFEQFNFYRQHVFDFKGERPPSLGDKKIGLSVRIRVFFWHDATMMFRSNRSLSISCVIPAFNEARNLTGLIPQILHTLSSMCDRVELIVVDDGSRDDTPQVMQALCAAHREVVYLQLSRNFGKEPALTAGIDATRGEVVFLMDADGQHPIALLPEMLEKWKQGSDVVYAVRKTRDDQSGLQVSLTGLFYKMVNFGNRVKIPANAGDFRLMDRKVVDALKSLPERNRFMKGLYAWVGFNSTAIDYQPLPRADGKSNFGLRGSLSLALTGILAFSIAPLRALTVCGLALSALALGYGGWVVVDFFVSGIAVPGYATIVVGMMFFSGIQLLSVGILAEYVGRIYEEVKQRPPYLISQRHGAGLPVVQETSLL